MFKVTMMLARSTKNTYRYEEVDEAGVLCTQKGFGLRDYKIGVLYIQKSAIGGNPPEAITVGVKAI